MPAKKPTRSSKAAKSTKAPQKALLTAKKAPKKVAKKAAKKAAKSKAKPSAKPKRRDAEKLVMIGITPPELAPGTPAYELDQRLRKRETRPSAAACAELPWLAQDQAMRAGFYLVTHGLAKHADHLELEICNVPGAFVHIASKLLTRLADYVLNSGAFVDGETMMVADDPLSVVSFLAVGARERGTLHEVPVLRVTFLR